MKSATRIAVGVLIGIGAILIVMFIAALFLIGNYDYETYEEIESTERE